MDAISEAYQLNRTSKTSGNDEPWELYFRKEIFTPWHDPSCDKVETDIIYQQVITCIKSDEYFVRNVRILIIQ